MPVFNAAPYLRPAVDSILSQTLTDFELLALDDGSTDGSAEILASYRDPRLRIVRAGANSGIVDRLNEGLDLAQGRYVARMDADDISRPDRLSLQAAFLDARPDVGICGAWARRFGADRRMMRPEIDPVAIRCSLLFESPLVHPSVMMRLDSLRRHGLRYRAYFSAEDIDLWQRAAECFPIANMPRVLLEYRVHASSVTGNPANAESQRTAMRSIDRVALARLGVDATDDELALHHRIRTTGDAPLEAVESWLEKLKRSNRKVYLYPEGEFERIVARRWFYVCNVARGWGALKWRRMRASQASLGLRVSALDAMKFAVRIR
jgi:glycosyltransferase involved in cell wall biosynthesis